MKKVLVSMFLPDVSWELPMVDLGEGPGGPRPPSYFGKKKKRIAEGRKRQQGKQQKKPGPPLNSRFGSTTDC